MRTSRPVRRALRAACAAVLAALTVAALLRTGAILPNRPELPVRGVDVSHYQGAIDWPELAGDDLRFAFVKATEGSDYTDETFAANWTGARDAGLRVGAYHFFSYDSPGSRQAAHFIETVPSARDALPPVIDVEFYGAYYRNPKPAEDVLPELRALVDALKAAYGARPILYVTEKSYALYAAGNFEDCDIWIRNVWRAPRLSDGRAWTFWQYADRARRAGCDGAEPFIDMNVFHGTPAQFDAYARMPQKEHE